MTKAELKALSLVIRAEARKERMSEHSRDVRDYEYNRGQDSVLEAMDKVFARFHTED